MSLLTSLPASITPRVLDTVLGRLAPLLLLGAADHTAARQAAVQMLTACNAETDDELRLAGNVIGLSFQCLEALSQAAAEDLSLTAKLRLRAGAVNLSRESHKAQRQLDKLQRARHPGRRAQPIDAQPIDAQPTEAQPTEAHPTDVQSTNVQPTGAQGNTVPAPQPDSQPDTVAADPPDATAPTERRPNAIGAHGKTGRMTWTQSDRKRQMAQRITDQLKQNQAKHAAGLALAQPDALAATRATVAQASPTAG